MVGLVHLAKSLASARSRVDDSHKLQQRKLAETLGYEYPGDNVAVPNEPEKGMFSVQGDTTHNHYHQPGSPMLGTVGKTIATILGSGGLGAAALLAWQLWSAKPEPKEPTLTPAPVFQDSDTIEGIRIRRPQSPS